MMSRVGLACALVGMALSLHGCDLMAMLGGGGGCDQVKIENGMIAAASPDAAATITCDDGFEFTGDAPTCGWVNKVCVAAARRLADKKEEAPAKEEEAPAEDVAPECANEYAFTAGEGLKEWPKDAKPREVPTAEDLPKHGAMNAFMLKLAVARAKAKVLMDKAKEKGGAAYEKAQAQYKSMTDKEEEAADAAADGEAPTKRRLAALPAKIVATKYKCTKKAEGGGDAKAKDEKEKLYLAQRVQTDSSVTSMFPMLFVGGLFISGVALVIRKMRSPRNAVQIDAEENLDPEQDGLE